jgi:PKD repeat protein
MPDESFTEERLSRAQKGDRAAFERLAGACKPRLEALIRLTLGSQLREGIEVDDIVQETLLRAFASTHTLRASSEAAIFRWLAGIANHAILEYDGEVLALGLFLPGDLQVGSSGAACNQRAARRRDRAIEGPRLRKAARAALRGRGRGRLSGHRVSRHGARRLGQCHRAAAGGRRLAAQGSRSTGQEDTAMLRTTFGLAFCVQLFSASLLGQVDPPPRYVSWGTYLGGSGHDVAVAIDADAEGNVYVCGRMASFDFLATAGVDAIATAGGADAAIVKLSADGSEVLAAAALQGPGDDIAAAISVLDNGQVVVAGDVAAGFAPPEDACRDAVSGAGDAFVALYDADLDLIAFQLLGGTGMDIAIDLHAAADGTVTLLGATNSANGLGTTPGAFQERYRGGESDFFVARLRLGADVDCGERVGYMTYLGSVDLDNNFPARVNDALHVGDDGLVTVAGTTWGPGTFPTTPNAFRSPSTMWSDVFVTQLRCDASLPRDEQLVYSAIIGGSSEEVPKSVEVLDGGAIRIMGWTWSGDFPKTEAEPHHGENDIYVTEIVPSRDPPSATQLRFSTFIPGSSYDPPYAGVTLPNGALLIGGLTISTNFPATPDAIEGFHGANEQACLLEVSTRPGLSAAERTPFSTALTPGTFCSDGDWNNCDRVYGLALAHDGSILVCGPTSGPISAPSDGAAQSLPAGRADWFVYRLQELRRPEARLVLNPESGVAPLEVCAGAEGSSTAEGTAIESFTYNFGDATEPMVRRDKDPACHRYENAGVYRISLAVANDRDLADTASSIIAVGCASGDVSPWTVADVGDVQVAGGARRLDDGAGGLACVDFCAAGGILTLRQDALHLLQRPFAGDGALSTRIEAIDGRSPSATAGLTWRESLDPGSPYAALLVDLRGRLQFRYRRADNAATERIQGPIVEFPVELRLERRGDGFTGFWRAPGDDGAPPTELGSVDIDGFGAADDEGADPEPPLAGAFATAGLSTTVETFIAASVRLCGLELIEGATPLRFRRGDCNDDTRVDISDASCVLNWLFLGTASPGCAAAVDANGDGRTDIADATYLLNHLFLGGAAPAAPYPDCGIGAAAGDAALGCLTPPEACRQ